MVAPASGSEVTLSGKGKLPLNMSVWGLITGVNPTRRIARETTAFNLFGLECELHGFGCTASNMHISYSHRTVAFSSSPGIQTFVWCGSHLHQFCTECKERRRKRPRLVEKHKQACLWSPSHPISKRCSDPGAFNNLYTRQNLRSDTQMLQVVVIQEGVFINVNLVPGCERRRRWRRRSQ